MCLQNNLTKFIFIEMAVSMWERMKPDERWVYEEQARAKKQHLRQVDFKKTFQPRRRHRAWI
jgi:hypothetical protein